MFENLKRKLTNFYYALGFGMKAGDELLTTSTVNVEAGTTIEQQMQQKSVYKDLLQGEVTQEVEALRYSTFKAEEKSMDYHYLGNGQAEKIEETEETKKKNRNHFIQPNLTVEYSVEEICKMDPKDAVNPPERKLFQIDYKNPCVRFKLEKYVDRVEVWCDDEKKKYKTTLIFENDPKNRYTRPLINYLIKVANYTRGMDKKTLKGYSERCEVLSDTCGLTFTTYKASNNVPNGIEHKFMQLKGARVIYNKEKEEVYVEYKWTKHTGGELLSERFYNKTQDEKYRNKERKENFAPMIDMSGE